MKRPAALTLALTLVACDQSIAPPPDGAVINRDAAEPTPDPGPRPHLITYRPASAGGPEAFREAMVGGVLDLRGPCVGLHDRNTGHRTIVTTAATRLRYDSLGWFLLAGKDRLRHGASVEAGGGDMAELPAATLLAAPVPASCGGPAVEMVGITRPVPRKVIPVTPPPPVKTR